MRADELFYSSSFGVANKFLAESPPRFNRTASRKKVEVVDIGSYAWTVQLSAIELQENT